MRRRVRLKPPAQRERWLISYADFITLLFAFFTTLYAISVVDAHKAQRLVHSLQESFGGFLFEIGQDRPRPPLRPEEGSARAQVERERAAADAQRLEGVRQRAEALTQDLPQAGALRVREEERGLVISLADSFFFEVAGGEIPAPAASVLAAVARELAPLPNHIRVEGHTDDVPIAAAAFPSNWHLSTARAVSVVIALEREGIPAFRLSASGFADQRPLVSNGSPEGRRLNRRVDVVVLRARRPNGDG